MANSDIYRFPQHPKPQAAKNSTAAEQARQKIAELPDTYKAHATPSKEQLAHSFTPTSPAADNTKSQVVKKMTEAAEPVVTKAGNVISPHAAKIPRPGRWKPLLTGLVTFVALFMLFKSPIFLSQIGYLTQKPDTAVTQTAANTPSVGPDPVIIIPKINVNAPVVFANSNVEANIQHDLESGVVHYADTAQPGENGNSVIFGHSSNDWWEPGNYKFVFVLLDKLVVGDTFTVNYQSKQYTYQVIETKVVEPTDVSVLNQTADPEMTLITCTPPGTSWKRLIIRAKQISPAPGATQTASAQTPTSNGILPSNSPSFTDQLNQIWNQIKKAFGKGQDQQQQPQTQPTTIPAAK
jgi:sortase A